MRQRLAAHRASLFEGAAPALQLAVGLGIVGLVEESDDLPEPDVLAQEIADDLQTALDQFAAIAAALHE